MSRPYREGYYTTKTITQIMPAGGWYAVWKSMSTRPDISEPLVAWALVRTADCRSSDDQEDPASVEVKVEGIVADHIDGMGTHCVEEDGNFLRYQHGG